MIITDPMVTRTALLERKACDAQEKSYIRMLMDRPLETIIKTLIEVFRAIQDITLAPP